MSGAPSAFINSISGTLPPSRCFDRKLRLENLPGRLRRYRLGLALFIISIAMLFVGFSSAYVVRRGVPNYDAQSGTYSSSWEPLTLPRGLLVLNTVWLAFASFSAEMARRKVSGLRLKSKAKKEASGFAWVLASLAFAIVFLTGQFFAWQKVRLDGHFLNSGPRTAFLYVFVGTHFFHAMLGVVFTAGLAVAFRRCSAANRILCTDLSAWYLHAMALLWFYLFGFLLIA